MDVLRLLEYTKEGNMMDYQVMTAFFLLTMITGLVTILYWAGVLEIEEFVEDEDLFRDF